MSKKILGLVMVSLLAMSLIFAGCGSNQKASEEKVLKVGCNADFAPFEFVAEGSGEYTGFDMDLIRAIGKEMGYKVDIQNINFDGLIPSLEAGNIDVIISGMTITEERAQKVAFSAPYYQSGLTIMVKENNANIKSFKDLEGNTIATQIGTTGATEAKKVPNANVKEFNSSADTFMELKIGGVEAVINDRPVNDYYLVQTGSKDFKALPDVLSAEDYGIAVNKKNTELKEKIDKALKALKDNGEYDKIYQKWFGQKK